MMKIGAYFSGDLPISEAICSRRSPMRRTARSIKLDRMFEEDQTSQQLGELALDPRVDITKGIRPEETVRSYL